ncbi:MAG: TlpA family protein disulfide reductase [Dehalococcoidia bacterium]
MQNIHKFASLIFLCVIAVISLTGCNSEGQSSEKFVDAPGFELSLLEHNQGLDLSNLNFANDLDGRPIIINFWYPSCPPCREEIPSLESTYKKYKDQGLVIVGIQSLVLDSVEDGRKFVNEFGITYPVGADVASNIQLSYKIIGFPTTFFINRDHQIIRKWSGLLDNKQLQEFVAEILE